MRYKALVNVEGDVRKGIKAGQIYELKQVLFKEGDISLKVWANLSQPNECLMWRIPFAVLQECFERQ